MRLRLRTPNPPQLPSLLGGLCLLTACLLTACAAGKSWVNSPEHARDDEGVRLVEEPTSPSDEEAVRQAREARLIGKPARPPVTEAELVDAPGDRPVLRLEGSKSSESTVPEDAPPDAQLLGVFRNTYYDFPSELDFSGSSTWLQSGRCEPLREVPRGFFEAVCVQGSGSLKSGETVSFARRDCSCAEVCPRTGQKICFDLLNQEEFPWGRGAVGTAIVPLRTVAVDTSVIPLGTRLYIAEFDGVARSPGGAPHDGCFVAEDRGLKVVGEHIDVFTGNPKITAHMNSQVPSNKGVHVYRGTARCQGGS